MLPSFFQGGPSFLAEVATIPSLRAPCTVLLQATLLTLCKYYPLELCSAQPGQQYAALVTYIPEYKKTAFLGDHNLECLFHILYQKFS